MYLIYMKHLLNKHGPKEVQISYSTMTSIGGVQYCGKGIIAAAQDTMLPADIDPAKKGCRNMFDF